MSLFPQDRVVGAFRGFSEGGLEFHADLVLPYNPDFARTAMHGQFVLVALEHDSEAVLGRITTVASEGRLVSPVGEDYAARAVLDDRAIPDDLRERFLKYKVDIRVLGVLRREGDKMVFAASHRRLPHVGSKVAFLSDELVLDVAGATSENGGAEIGYLALGEYIYAGNDSRLAQEPWMHVVFPAVTPKFEVGALVSRRTFVFARAGFGKSNLNKLLFSELYRTDPVVEKRGRQVPVGTVIFDPEGEYFWPDDKGRPGFCDIDHLKDRLVVFTNREAPSQAYGSFVVDGVKLDIRQLPPWRVVGIVLPEERQEQQNVLKLKQLGRDRWRQLVDLVATHRHNADLNTIAQLLGLEHQAGPNVEAVAARSNMSRIVATLHDPNSQMLTVLMAALSEGKLCVVDISQMRGKAGLDLAGIILAEIFEHNQEEFTAADSQTIPTIAVIEEAQAVLGAAQAKGEGPFVEWVKEGRKYDLGAVLVTQQPGSISGDILSQGDNWFIFHLLSQQDLRVLNNANAHFSDDLLASLLNEPLPGHGVYWSSARQRPYPLPIRVFDFTAAYRDLLDSDNSGGQLDIYAVHLRDRFVKAREEAAARAEAVLEDEEAVPPGEVVAEPPEDEGAEGITEDLNSKCTRAAIAALGKRPEFHEGVSDSDGVPWWQIQQWLAEYGPYPSKSNENWDWAYTIVPRALDETLGAGKWRTERRPDPKNPAKERSFIFKGG